MSLPETIWWCVPHKQSGTKPNKSCVWAYGFGGKKRQGECRMVEWVGGDRESIDYEAAAKVLRDEKRRYRAGWNPLSHIEMAKRVVDAALGLAEE